MHYKGTLTPEIREHGMSQCASNKLTLSALEKPGRNGSLQSVFCVYMSSHAFTLHFCSLFSPGRQNISDNSLFQHLCLMLADYHCTSRNQLDKPRILSSLL